MATQFPEESQLEVQINHFFDHLARCLDQRRMELLDKVQEIAARPAALARKEQELMKMRTETERGLRSNELREFQERILAGLDEKLAEVRTLLPETRVIFRGRSQELEQLIRGVGEVVEEVAAVEPLNVPKYQDIGPIVAVAKRGQTCGHLWSPRGVAIEPNTNQIYIAEGMVDASRVSVFSATGEFLGTFTHQQMRNPWGIAVHGDSVYVTDIVEHSVFHFKVGADIHFRKKIGSRGSGDLQFNDPRQLTVSVDGEVFVADRCNSRIQVLDRDLQFQRCLSHDSLRYPCDVKLTPDEIYVLTDWDSPCVYVLSYAGEKIRSLVTRGAGMLVIEPAFFCLDENGNMVISDRGASQVKIVSGEGALLHTIGTPGHEVGGLTKPFGIALTSELKLVVASLNDNYRLQIFSSK